MADAVDDFFTELAGRGDEPLLRTVTGTVRFDVAGDRSTDQWVVGIDRGAITVAHRGGDADCVIGGARSLLDAIFRGEANAMAAVLRGELTCAGDLEMIFAVQRLFPGRADAGAATGGDRRG
jgi:putative sterol carrier protein